MSVLPMLPTCLAECSRVEGDVAALSCTLSTSRAVSRVRSHRENALRVLPHVSQRSIDSDLPVVCGANSISNERGDMQ